MDPAAGTEHECPQFLSQQLITYIGNKRSLLGVIGQAVGQIRQQCGGRRLRILDLFSGSGVVSRFLKQHASALHSNDFESYAATVARCYLSNHDQIDQAALRQLVEHLNHQVDQTPHPQGFLQDLYAPRNEQQIDASDRVFYTRNNARRLDHYRQLIDTAPPAFRDLLLGPLLSAASIHANTAGVFKGFYKNRSTGVGQFGGTAQDAIGRIRGTIQLTQPLLSRFNSQITVTQSDANQLVRSARGFDLVYLDPPYNQHPYGSNYFMLNLIARYQAPGTVSKVSGIPADWQRSGYNVRRHSLPLLADLLGHIDAPYLLISYSNEGFISPADMTELLRQHGRVSVIEAKHNAFRGSRNLANRPLHVVEQLFLVER